MIIKIVSESNHMYTNRVVSKILVMKANVKRLSHPLEVTAPVVYTSFMLSVTEPMVFC